MIHNTLYIWYMVYIIDMIWCVNCKYIPYNYICACIWYAYIEIITWRYAPVWMCLYISWVSKVSHLGWSSQSALIWSWMAPVAKAVKCSFGVFVGVKSVKFRVLEGFGFSGSEFTSGQEINIKIWYQYQWMRCVTLSSATLTNQMSEWATEQRTNRRHPATANNTSTLQWHCSLP